MTKEGLKETWVYWSYRSVTVKRYEEKNMIPREEAKPRIVSAANGIYKIYEERETLGKTGRVRISEVVYEKAAEYYFVGGRLAGWKFLAKRSRTAVRFRLNALGMGGTDEAVVLGWREDGGQKY